MKIGVLYICTGKYNQFFANFYDSCEKYFLRDSEKEYYVFTDNLELCKESNVHLIYRQCLGFPMDSLLRFEMFLTVENKLRELDYIYFFNSNALFLSEIGYNEILPNNSGLVGAEWPGKRKPFKHPMFYPYERNSKSTAYLPPRINPPYTYYMGGINGGTSKQYLQMIKTLSYNIRLDLDKGIIAEVHDESHINAYFHNRHPRCLESIYCWPEEWISNESPKIIFRDKVKIDPFFNKKRGGSFKGLFLKSLKIISRGLTWYLTFLRK